MDLGGIYASIGFLGSLSIATLLQVVRMSRNAKKNGYLCAKDLGLTTSDEGGTVCMYHKGATERHAKRLDDLEHRMDNRLDEQEALIRGMASDIAEIKTTIKFIQHNKEVWQ